MRHLNGKQASPFQGLKSSSLNNAFIIEPTSKLALLAQLQPVFWLPAFYTPFSAWFIHYV